MSERSRKAMQASRAGTTRAHAHFLLNRLTYHLQNLVREVHHFVRGRDMIHGFCQNFFFRLAASFELASRNEIVAVQNFRHSKAPPPQAKQNKEDRD